MIKTTKVLCHADGAPFCNYHRDHERTAYTYALYLCDADTPPDPTTLDIDRTGGGATDVSTLRWYPIEAYVTKREQVLGTFDEIGGFHNNLKETA